MADRHGSREVEIFRRFARAAGLLVDEASVEKRSPPEPDILYLAGEREPVAFELVELIDQAYAQRTWDQLKLKAKLETSYEALEPARKSPIQQQVGNTLIHVVFEGDATFKAREDAIDLVFETLASLDAAFEGELRRRDGAGLAPAVHSIRVNRLDSAGPYFDVDAVGPLADPTVDTIHGKWTKIYSTPHPVELLAYYELQPELREAFWRQQLESFLDGNSSTSPFRRVWVYDCGAQAVRFASAPLAATRRRA